MIYLDTSAAVNALVDEPGSDLVRAVFAAGDPFVSSRLLRVELHAAVSRRWLEASGVDELLARVSLVGIDDDLLDRAVELGSGLRALDSLHLATAVDLAADIEGMLGYDRELITAARREGIPAHPACG